MSSVSSPLVVEPWLVGSGGSSLAIEAALGLLALRNPRLALKPIRNIPRGTAFSSLPIEPSTALLCLASPHGLHAAQLEEASKAGFRRVAIEKPLAVRSEELRFVPPKDMHVAVLHGYRVLWGPREIARRIAAGELGELISVEGHYRQSSAAQVAVGEKPSKRGWKDDPKLSGPYDVALDLGTHWVDLASYFAGALPSGDRAKSRVLRSYAGAEAPHRDTLVHCLLEHDNGVRSLGSIAKCWHGAVNDLTVTVLGTKASLTWRFETPDQLFLNQGSRSEQIVRTMSEPSWSRLSAGHGMGWVDGYIAVLGELLAEWEGSGKGLYPRWDECSRILARYFALLED